MMFTRRILLVGTDARFAQQVQTHLHKSFLITAPSVRFEDLPNIVRRDTDGVLLFLASDARDDESIDAAVRELRLRQWPARLAVLASEQHPASRRLDAIAEHFDANFVWPGHLREFNAWIRRAVVPGTPFPDAHAESPAQRFRAKLLPSTPSLAPMIERLETAAAHGVSVLIEGEPGTGKTHLAKVIHDCSRRAAHRFLTVACGSTTGNPLAAEFFGHVKGAFAGADTEKVGKFEAAGEGTLMLDEIDLLAPDQQASLLRVIETGEFEPLGSPITKRSAARIIAASNWNLADAVERGTLRSDLYYRLNVLAFRLPPLRDRTGDIAPLARGMVARYSTRFSKRIGGVHPEVLRALEAFPWPGNIRQLENVIQQSVLSCTGEELRLQHLPPIVHNLRAEANTATPMPGPGLAGSLAHNRETTERAAILRALEKVSFSRTRAAEVLGVSRVTLYKKMKKYGLLAKPGSGTPPPQQALVRV